MAERPGPDPAGEPATGLRWRDAALIAHARAFGHPCKIRILRWLARRLAAGRIMVRYAPGAAVAVDPADYIGWAIVRTGHYEPASLDLALRLMRRDPGLFVDVGANFGWYTCAVAAVTGSTVVSIEPHGGNRAALRRNIALNKRTNVAVFAGAVGAVVEVVQMIGRAAANSGAVAVEPADREMNPADDWVAAMPLDGLLERIVRPAVRPTLVKIDVEGYEPRVLAGLDLGGKFRPKNILMEYVDDFAAWRSFDDVRTFFAASGYRLTDVFGRRLVDARNLPEANIWACEDAP
jgi:FkbM family methyltransferase